MTDEQLIRWLDAQLFDLLISLTLFMHFNPQISIAFDNLRELRDTFVLHIAEARRLNLLPQGIDLSAARWPADDPVGLVRRAWTLGYIQEAAAAKTAMVQAGAWTNVTL